MLRLFINLSRAAKSNEMMLALYLLGRSKVLQY